MKLLKRALLPALLIMFCLVTVNASAADMSSPDMWKKVCKMKVKMYKSQYKHDMKMYNMTKKMCGYMQAGNMSKKMYRKKMGMCKSKLAMYMRSYNADMKKYRMTKQKCRMMR